jgi:Methyltransferase domain
MKTVKQVMKSAATRLVARARQVPTIRRILEEPKMPTATPSWQELDAIYSDARRRLVSVPNKWRHGPGRVHIVAKEAHDALSAHSTVRGATYLDLGCGSYHPYGISAVMYLNGASRTVATDISEFDKRRASEALGDLLLQCLAFPDEWHWSGSPRSEYLERIGQFDLKALQAGDLAAGLGELPLEHHAHDIHDASFHPCEADWTGSRAVLEHFLDFATASKRIFALMRPGGFAYHHIDLSDHRSHLDSKYHKHSFLAEAEDWSDGLVNRLRPRELREAFEQAGFEVVDYRIRHEALPDDFESQIRGRFRSMSADEWTATGVYCLLRRPEVVADSHKRVDGKAEIL